MAKKSKKGGCKSLVLSVLAIIFGLLLFSTMFMPMIAVSEGDEKVSSVNVVSAMGVETIADALELNENEAVAYSMIKEDNTMASTKASAILNLMASIFGGLTAVVGLLSLVVKAKSIKLVTLCLAILGTLLAVGSLVSVVVLLNTKIALVMVKDLMSIYAAPILAVVAGALTSLAVALKK